MRVYLSLLILAIALGLVGYLPGVLTDSIELDDATRAELEGEFAPLSMGDTYYRIRGPEDGEPLVLVHGYSTPGNIVWEPLLEHLPQDKYRVLSFDLYGRGFSDRPDVDYGAEVYQRQLLELLAATGFDREPFNLLGYSMGGAVVSRFTAENPDLVKHLVMIAPAGYPLPTSSTTKVMTWPFIGSWLFHVLGPSSLAASWDAEVQNGTISYEMLKKFNRQLLIKDTLDALHKTLLNYAMGAQQQYFQAIGQFDAPRVGVIWGSLDQVTPFVNSIELVTDIPRAELCTLEGNHNITLSMPSQVAQCFQSLLSEASAEDASEHEHEALE